MQRLEKIMQNLKPVFKPFNKLLMRSFGIKFTSTKYDRPEITEIPDLGKIHLKNIQVIPNREKLLKELPEKSTGAEIGVAEGDYSEKILEVVDPEEMILIDPWSSETYGESMFEKVREKFYEEVEQGKVKIMRGFSGEELEKLEDDSLDWAYIDTTHQYEQTLKELKLCSKKVKDGGIIAGHDYCKGNVRTSIAYGVVEAVHKFCLDYDYELLYLTLETQGNSSFGVRKIKK